MQPKSGYKTVTPIQMGNALHLLQSRVISVKGAQVYFACISILAIREAARRSGARTRFRQINPHYRLSELCKLTRLSERTVRRELKTLSKFKLLDFTKSEICIAVEPVEGSTEILAQVSGKRSPRRPIPIPRSILRSLACCHQRAHILTLAVYMCRGLSLSRVGEGSARGSVKASWIASTTGLSLRSVRSIRARLIELGVITRDTGSHQRKLNRDGAYFQINVDWQGPADYGRAEKNIGVEERTSRMAIGPRIATISAPLACRNGAGFAPPKEYKKTPYGVKDQKAYGAMPPVPAGFCRKRGRKPTIRNILPEDLSDFFRMEVLFEQATRAGWVKPGESSFLNWLGAAVRAKTQSGGDSVRIFVGIAKRGLFFHITHQEEERARAAIHRFRYGGCKFPPESEISDLHPWAAGQGFSHPILLHNCS